MPETLRANSRPRKKATPFESNAVASQFNASSSAAEPSSSFAEEQNTWGGFEEPSIRQPLKRQGGSYWKGVLIVVIIAAIVGIAGYMSTKSKMGAAPKKGETYNAVFLNNGQVYFGVIKKENNQHLILDNVFYLQLVNETVPAAVEGGEPQVVQRPQLVKKGDEYYGPNTSIRINRSQIAVVEELREDSDVLRQIKERLTLEAQAATPPTPSQIP